MSSKKVSELNELSVFSDAAYVPVVDGGTTYKMSLENLLQKTIRVDKSSEISTVATKTVTSNSDLIMLEDSASSNTKKKCTKEQFLHDVPQVITGTDNPISTPLKKGMIYIDTAHSQIYISKDSTSSDDWLLLN